MNKKGSTGPIGALLLFLIFVLNWFIWLGSWINTSAEIAIQAGNLTGVEAFLVANLNFAVFIIVILAMLGWMYFTSE